MAEVKISKLEEGAVIEIDGRKEFISKIINKGEGFFTLSRGDDHFFAPLNAKERIIENGYTANGDAFPGCWGIITKEHPEYNRLNEKLTRYEKNGRS